jgi:hypothetical protein
MRLHRLSHSDSRLRFQHRHASPAIGDAARLRPYIEALDRRILLSSSYNVPLTTGGIAVTDVYLTAGSNPGDVLVHLNSKTATSVATLTPSSLDNSESIHGNRSGLVLHDFVSAANKPTGGIHFDNSSSGVLEIDSDASDTLIEVTDSSTVTTSDGTHTGADVRGTGVSVFSIVVNDAGYAVVNATAHYLTLNNALRIETGSGTHDTINIGGGENSGITDAIIHTGAGNDVVHLDQDDDADASTTASIDFGSGTGSGNGLGLGNELDIGTSISGVNCTATLAQAAGTSSHTIVVDTINVGYGGSVVVASQSTAGDVHLFYYNSAASVEAPLLVASSTSTSGTFTDDGVATFTGASNASTIATLALGGTLNVNYGADLTATTFEVTSSGTVNAAADAQFSVTTANVSGTVNIYLTSDTHMDVEFFNGSGTVNVNSGGTLTVGTFDVSGTVNVNAGIVYILNSSTISTLNVSNNGRVTLAPRSTRSGSTLAAKVAALYLNNLNLGSVGSEDGILDLNDNDLVVEYGFNSTPFQTLWDYMADGYSGSVDTSKKGIISSTGQATGTTVLALFDNGLLSPGGATEWPLGTSRTIDNNSVIGKYTYFGDANFDGQVTPDDYGVVDANLNTTPPLGLAWLTGDVNFDGIVSGDDYGVIDANLGEGTSDPL